MNFLSNVLREDGGFEYKKAIVEAILVLIRDIPEAKEQGLAQLCEFIEDCEFTFLSVQILHLLGEEGPRTKDPGGWAGAAGPSGAGRRLWRWRWEGKALAGVQQSHNLCSPLVYFPAHLLTCSCPTPPPAPAARYIRFIYNRVILENATVRAAALSSLARFGAHCPELTPRIILLLKRALYDNDDEVSERGLGCERGLGWQLCCVVAGAAAVSLLACLCVAGQGRAAQVALPRQACKASRSCSPPRQSRTTPSPTLPLPRCLGPLPLRPSCPSAVSRPCHSLPVPAAAGCRGARQRGPPLAHPCQRPGGSSGVVPRGTRHRPALRPGEAEQRCAGWGGAVGCGLATIPHPALHAAGWLWMAAARPHARHVVPPKC